MNNGVGAGKCQEHKPLITNTHTKRGKTKFTRFDKMPTSPGQKRDILIIYTRYKRIIIGSLKNSHQNS